MKFMRGKLRSLKFWFKQSYESVFKMAILSACLSGISIAFVVTHGISNVVSLFSFFFFMYFVSLQLLSRIVIRHPQVLFHEMTHELKQLEEKLKTNVNISNEIKFQLSFKFKELDYFIQQIMSRPFLYSNFYDPEFEKEYLISLITQVIENYNEKWALMNINQKKIDMFNNVHDSNTRIYMDAVLNSLTVEKSPYIRRTIFRAGLVKLMKHSIKDFIKVVG